MKRWQVLSFLSITAVVAAVVVPNLRGPGVSPDSRTDRNNALPERSTWSQVTPTPDAATSGALSIRAGLDRSVLSADDSERYLVVEVTADEGDTEARTPVDLSLVVDVSGSMGGANKIDYAYKAARELVAQLDERDRFSLVTFDDTAQVAIAPTAVTERAPLYHAIDGMFRGGGTDIYSGLSVGLQQVVGSEHGGARRVVLLSDGQDSSSLDGLAGLAGANLEQGVTVSALGVGLDFDADKLMAIAAAGGGKYHYVSDSSMLVALFQDELSRAGSVAARGARVNIDVAEGVELLEVYGYDGYSGGATGDGWSAFLGDVYQGQTRKIVARVRVPEGTPDGAVATVKATYVNPEQEQAREADLSVRAAWGDRAAAAASTDRSLGLHAARAVAGVAMKQSTAWWTSGDVEKARAAARARVTELSTLGDLFGDDIVQKPLANLEALMAQQDTVAHGSRDALEMDLRSQLEALGYME